jgi:hypothetical protein
MRLIIGLLLAVLATAAYVVGNFLARPATPAPAVPAPPSEPGIVVCPSPTATHTALWSRRGDPCPQVTTTMTIGGEPT